MIYTLFMALEFKNHATHCIHGTFPLDQVIVNLDLVVFAVWVCSNPLFMVVSYFLGYTS
jgi:hypothetical protein